LTLWVKRLKSELPSYLRTFGDDSSIFMTKIQCNASPIYRLHPVFLFIFHRYRFAICLEKIAEGFAGALDGKLKGEKNE